MFFKYKMVDNTQGLGPDVFCPSSEKKDELFISVTTAKAKKKNNQGVYASALWCGSVLIWHEAWT